MFGFFRSYDEEYSELYEYLSQNWGMKQKYAKAFLDAYKKSIGKIFSKGKKRMDVLENCDDLEKYMMAVSSGGPIEHALVGQAYKAYMSDLRHGNYIDTPVELAIWAILLNRPDLTGTVDSTFEKWIDEKQEEKFPNLFDEVFQVEEDEV